MGGLSALAAFLMWLAAAGFSTTYAQSADEAAPGAAIDEDAFVLVFLANDRPLFFRFHVDIDGKGFRTAWDEYVTRLFGQLDADGDGGLTSSEMEQGPWTQFVAGQFDEYAAKTFAYAWDVQPADEAISPSELAGGLQAIDAALDVQSFEGAASAGAAGNRLMEVIDENGNKRLSREEMASAFTRLRKLDLDDDGTMSLEEIRPFENPFFRRAVDVQSRNRNGTSESAPNPFFLLTGRRSIRLLIPELLNRYDRASPGVQTTGDNRLSADEFRLESRTFQQYDADGNGELTTREIRALLERPPIDVDLVVRIGQRDSGVPAIALAGDGPNSSPPHEPEYENNPSHERERVAFRFLPGDAPTLTLGNVQVQFAVQSAPSAEYQKQDFLRRFDSADADDNDYLDAAEAARGGLGPYFPAMDRDNDAKVFKQEMTAFVDDQTEAARSRTVLNLRDNGSELFELVDTGGDGRLSRRELSTMQERLAVWDADGDGEIGADESIHNYRVTLSRGSVNLFSSPVVVNRGSRSPRIPQPRGPLWFQKMDRNRDGDLSRREFFGPSDAFDRLDADGDGLIDPDEAEAGR